jgi:protein phosphatase
MPPIPALCIDGLTDTGNRRQNNEDAWWAGQLGGDRGFMEPSPAPLRVKLGEAPALLLVSDGVGGANAGEVASQMAVTQISEGLTQAAAALHDSKAILPTIRAVVESTNNAITAKAAEPGFDGMGATLSLLCLAADANVYWAQAGDSRIYLCRHGRLRQISHDHSPVGRLRQTGKLTEAEARSHPLRNQIDQSLGDPNAVFAPDTGSEPYQQGDVFLLCSDGLSDGLWDHEIEETLVRRLRTAADVRPTVQELVAKAKAASGRDNITAVLAFVETGPAAASTIATLAARCRRWLGR